MDADANTRSFGGVERSTGTPKSYIRAFLFGLLAWEVCVLGSFLALLAFTGKLALDRNNFDFFGYLAVYGLFIVLAVSIISRRLGEYGVGIAGALCGVVPSLVIITETFIAPNGVDVSASFILALTLAVSSGLGRAIAGFIYAYGTNSLLKSDAIF